MYDVIIVGAGTVGLTLANLLAKIGLKICLIEKKSSIHKICNAAGVNEECLLAWQFIGVLEELKAKECLLCSDDNSIILQYLEEENSKEIFSLRQRRKKNLPVGVVILQNKIDEVLLGNLEQKIHIKFNEEVLFIKQDSDKVIVSTNQNNTYLAKYLIAADGKNSSIRKLLNIDFAKLSESKDHWLILNLLVNDHFKTPHFAQVFCGSLRSAVSCPLPQNNHRIEISLLAQENDIINDEEKIRDLLSKYICFNDYRIIDKFEYQFITGIAKKYYQNRIALCGDAAHQSSPFASSGLVSGIRDCLSLYEIFKDKQINFSSYQKARYQKQLQALKLAIRLEVIMRPPKFIEKLLFTTIRIVIKNPIILRFLSLRN